MANGDCGGDWGGIASQLIHPRLLGIMLFTFGWITTPSAYTKFAVSGPCLVLAMATDQKGYVRVG